MSLTELELLNRESSEELGWVPADFSALDFDQLLVANVIALQRDCGLEETGWVDDSTYRRLTVVQDLDHGFPQRVTPPPVVIDHFLFDGVLVPCPGVNVVTEGEPEALVIPRTYKKGGKPKSRYYKRARLPEEITSAIVHWDATSRCEKTYDVLVSKGISSNFVIAWDGTVYQMVDAAHGTYHAGIGLVNKSSIGIDMNTTATRSTSKYFDRVQAKLRGLGRPRPIVDGVKINGWSPGAFLGCYQAQEDALAHLLAALSRHTAIPLARPASTGSPRDIRRISGPSEFTPGVYHHAEVDWRRTIRGKKNAVSGKWDTSCTDLDRCVRVAQEWAGAA